MKKVTLGFNRLSLGGSVDLKRSVSLKGPYFVMVRRRLERLNKQRDEHFNLQYRLNETLLFASGKK